ncbi:MAG: hypothetical protein CVU09_13510 [Bacteroidetes bacterium HGW-Bacteroidetes-4]|jgi:signal transduction histidine kinase/ligand-binding sensor domain-containing protein|nr:MAG: hypothetical protein CVU09_13510 [Bacteroidetes bacterium HGW-Bacteroidetes-4]
MIKQVKLLIFMLIVALAGQAQDIKFYNLTIDEGLPQSSVLSIHQDNKGFIWLSSFDGVTRFDGKNLTTFIAASDNPYTLNNGTVYKICSDFNDNLYFATNGGGLNVYNQKTELFDYYTSNNNNSTGIVGDALNYVFTSSDSAIWIAALNGVSRFYPESKTFDSYPSSKESNKSFPYYSALCIEEDSKGHIWFGTYGGGISRFNKNAGTFSTFYNKLNQSENYTLNIINHIKTIDDENLLLATAGGVYRFHIPDSSFYLYQNIQTPAAYIMQDKSNDIWIATITEGLIKIDDKGNKELIKANSLVKNSLPENRIYTIFEDKQENIWLGFYSKGFAYFSDAPTLFYHYNHDKNKNSLIGNEVYGLAEDHNNHIWIGTLDGLSIFKPEAREFENFKAGSGNKTIAENRIWSLFYDNIGYMWLGFANGAGIYDYESGTFSTFYHQPNDSTSLPSNEVLAFEKDKNGQIWVGCYGGLATYDYTNKQFKQYTNNVADSATSFNQDVVWDIFSDSKKQLWVGTGKGLFRFDYDKSLFFRYPTNYTSDHILLNTEINQIHEDNEGYLWLATPKGLIRFNIQTEEALLFDTQNGLPNSVIYSVLEHNDNLWVTTNKGMCRLNKNNFDLAIYNVNDGLQSNEFNPARLKTHDGKFIFGGVNGITVFDPEALANYAKVPQLYFTKLYLNGQLVKPNMERYKRVPIKLPVSETKSIKLSHHEKHIQLEFSAIDYLSADKIKYAYRILPNTPEWIPLKNQSSLTLTNLRPGKYKLQVRSTNNEMAWADNTIELCIRIYPPIYQQTWFYVLESLLLIILIFWYIRHRTQRIKKANLKLEQLVEERTEEVHAQNEELKSQRDRISLQKTKIERFAVELERKVQKRTEQYREAKEKAEESDRLKSAFLANMSHEIRTPLNAIIGFSELLMQNQLEEKERKEYLKLINNNGNSLLLLLNDIIEISMIETGKIEFIYDEVNVSDIIKSIYSDFQEHKQLNEKPQVKLFLNDKELDKDLNIITDSLRLKQIIAHLIDNGIKYTRVGQVTLSFKKDQNYVIFSVNDTGIGIEPKKIEQIFDRFYKADNSDTNPYRGGGLGLAIAKNLITMMGGNIWVQSVPGMGSTFYFTIPINPVQEN